jgi:hypothetical protein
MHWVDFSDLSWTILNTGYSLSLTPFIGIVKGFFDGNGVGYDIGYAFDVIGYISGCAENYDCLNGMVWYGIEWYLKTNIFLSFCKHSPYFVYLFGHFLNQRLSVCQCHCLCWLHYLWTLILTMPMALQSNLLMTIQCMSCMTMYVKALYM